MKKTISIVFGTYNRKDSLKKLLASIPEACRGLEYELVITDGGSTDGTQQLLADYPVTLIEHGELRGPVAAYNDAFRACKGDYVAFINDDLEFVGSKVLKDAVNMLENDPGIGVVSLPYTSADDNGQKVRWAMTSRPDAESGNSFTAASFGVLSRQNGERVGWFSDYFYHYYGDSHLCMSLQELGKRTEPMNRRAVHHFRLNNAVRGFAWWIEGAKERSQYDGLLFQVLWGGYSNQPTCYGLDRRLACQLRDYFKLGAFIETGTYRGESSEWATSEFKVVATIENDHKRYERVKERIGRLSNLLLIEGDSREELKRLLNRGGYGDALIWLDAHCRDWTGNRWEGNDQNPLKKELYAILSSQVRHIIMIDDAWWIKEKPPFTNTDPEQWVDLGELEKILSNYDVLYRHGWNLFAALPKVKKPVLKP